MIFGIRSILLRIPLYVIWYFLFYYLGGHGSMPISGIVILAISMAVDLIFFFDLFILDQHQLKIRFVLNPFKKDIVIPLERIKEIILYQVGIKMARTGVKIYLKDYDKYISFMVNFSGGELDRLMKKVRSLGIEICDLNDQ